MEQDVLLLLRLEHRNQARVLALLEDQAAMARGRQAVDLELVRGIADYFGGYPELCHHPKENALFRKLEARDSEAAASVTGVLAEHRELSSLAARLSSQVEAATQDSLIGNSDFADTAYRYAKLLRLHMKMEEESFFPLVQEALTDSDWAEIDFQVFDQDDPLFSAAAEHRFEKLRNQLFQSEFGARSGSA